MSPLVSLVTVLFKILRLIKAARLDVVRPQQVHVAIVVESMKTGIHDLR